MLVGYKLVDANNVSVQEWGGVWGRCPGIPNPIILPNGDHVHAPSVGVTYEDWTLIEWNMDESEAPPPDPAPPILYAVAQLTVADGEISGIDIASQLSAAMWLDVGQYYIFFTATQADTSYLAKAYDGTVRAYVREEDKFTDYFVVTVVDMEGNPTDATNLSLEIIRVN